MKIGSRVQVVRNTWHHPDFRELVGARGRISEVLEPMSGEEDLGERFEVELDLPNGPRSIVALFPLYARDLELLEE